MRAARLPARRERRPIEMGSLRMRLMVAIRLCAEALRLTLLFYFPRSLCASSECRYVGRLAVRINGKLIISGSATPIIYTHTYTLYSPSWLYARTTTGACGV